MPKNRHALCNALCVRRITQKVYGCRCKADFPGSHKKSEENCKNLWNKWRKVVNLHPEAYGWILNNNKKARNVEQNGKLVKYRNRENEVLFIDLRQWGEPFEKKYIQFSQEQIQRIAENFHNWQHVGYEETYHNEPEYCYSATLDEIEQKGWSLVPSKYIEFRNRDEQIDFDTKMRQLQTEMRDLLKQEEASKEELKALFEKLWYSL